MRVKGRKRGSKNMEIWQKDILNEWIASIGNNMYPSESEKQKVARLLKVTKKKVSNWIINRRKRLCQDDPQVQIYKYRYKAKYQIEKQKAKKMEEDMKESESINVGQSSDIIENNECSEYCICEGVDLFTNFTFDKTFKLGFNKLQCEQISNKELNNYCLCEVGISCTSYMINYNMNSSDLQQIYSKM